MEYTVTNTDDFIWRLVKGCIQLGLVPDINNSINMVPVDHVAQIISTATVSPLTEPNRTVLHVSATPPPSYKVLFSALSTHGWKVDECEYLNWRGKLEQHVLENNDNALFPLLHFVLDDLPTSTKAPELNNANTALLLSSQGYEAHATVTPDLTGLYLSWLVNTGFLPHPSHETAVKPLPKISDDFRGRAVNRTGV